MENTYHKIGVRSRALGITVSGVHCLRTNYAQNLHKEFLENEKSDREARQEVSHRLGHNRVEVTNGYIPHRN